MMSNTYRRELYHITLSPFYPSWWQKCFLAICTGPYYGYFKFIQIYPVPYYHTRHNSSFGLGPSTDNTRMGPFYRKHDIQFQ